MNQGIGALGESLLIALGMYGLASFLFYVISILRREKEDE